MQSITLRVFRCDPAGEESGRYDRFQVPVGDHTTVLDALAWVQTTHDPTLAFRYACRVGMCGSCAMVVNGRERWTCRTRLRDLGRRGVTVRPLYHFPLVKDLVVDMAPFWDRMRRVEAAYRPAEERQGFAPVSRDSSERRAIDRVIECIGCGACVSACTMVGWRAEFPGPAALMRAFTLVEDSREGGRGHRLAGLLSEDALWHCHTQLNCTAVCPMELSPTEAILGLKRLAVAWRLHGGPSPEPAAGGGRRGEAAPRDATPRRRLLQGAVWGVGAALILPAAGLLGAGVLGRRAAPERWVRVGRVPALPPGRPTEAHYEVLRREQGRERAVGRRVYLVETPTGPVAFDPQCTHLGCATRWDDATRLFLCPCHGGGFDLEGRVVMGPPPRPLRRLPLRRDGADFYLLSR